MKKIHANATIFLAVPIFFVAGIVLANSGYEKEYYFAKGLNGGEYKTISPGFFPADCENRAIKQAVQENNLGTFAYFCAKGCHNGSHGHVYDCESGIAAECTSDGCHTPRNAIVGKGDSVNFE